MFDLWCFITPQICKNSNPARICFSLRETGATTKDDLSVVLGEFDLSSDSDSFDTKRFWFSWLASSEDSSRKNVQLAIDPIVHEDYNSPQSLSNDIALLKLAEEVKLNKIILTYVYNNVYRSTSTFTLQHVWRQLEPTTLGRMEKSMVKPI